MVDVGGGAQLALLVVVGVPMVSVTVVWKHRRSGHREDVDLVESVLLWTAVSQMVVVFGLAGWIVVPGYRSAAPVPTVLGTELLGVLCGTIVVGVDLGLWWMTGRLPSRREQEVSADGTE